MNKPLLLALACTAALSVIGCNMGMTPSGGSDTEVKAAFDKLPLEDRAKSILSSPAPMDAKKKKIEEMYAKEGKKVPDSLFNGAGAMQ
jgi:hypothetical protein